MTQTVESVPESVDTVRHTHVLIVGGGFGGLGLAVRLGQQGVTDFLLIERGDDVGGTWRDNTYPGAGCDVPSHLYSYSFALNPEWSHSFSSQQEIQEYIRSVADRYGVRDRAIFGCEMLSAHWDEEHHRWDVRTSNGTITADVLISATGPLSEPNLPDIKGISGFQGEIFHSSRWNHDSDLIGKRVAVIGTGASALQVIPSIAEDVAHLDVYQRTAAWVLPRFLRRYTAPERFAFRHVPGLPRAWRSLLYASRELYVLGLVKYPPLMTSLELVSLVKMWLEIRDPKLRKQVTPDHRLGCKRMMISNDYYPTLGRDHVDLVTDGIKEVREHSIVTEDGTERDVDAIVLCTGFRVTDSPAYDKIFGRDGRSMRDLSHDAGTKSYKGTAVTNYPNHFMILGPNSGSPYTSLVYVIESQIAYICDALETMRERGIDTVEVRPEVLIAYDEGVQQKMAKTVWVTGGCNSWFLDSEGNNTTMWPDFSFRYRRLVKKFDLSAYSITRPADRPVTTSNA